ncbi:MAG: epoxyqueuosine reductase [Clostridia bacterium]|nr:epoxyqueuosine reductase [Clostridia bacterium]MBQ9919718.1 epoxyqueuosine reductase [Clostridia bacterium]
MKDFLAEILKESCIEYYGFCEFSALENQLLNCSAKLRLPLNSATVITLLFPYKVLEEKPLNISRYAAVEDYHFVCEKILKNVTDLLKQRYENFQFEWFIDNSPINEVKAAVLSGLGVRGKNNLLINEKYGSFCFIGEIVTDYKIQTVNNLITNCINCGICVKNCPSGFLSDKNNKCLSAITQQKGELSQKEIALIKQNKSVWGCDICQNLCPMNKNSSLTPIKAFINSYRNEFKEDEDFKNRAYTWRGENVIKRNLKIM